MCSRKWTEERHRKWFALGVMVLAGVAVAGVVAGLWYMTIPAIVAIIVTSMIFRSLENESK